MVFGANRYVFSNVREFNQKQNLLLPTPKPFIPFGESRDMQGLSYVFFTHPVSFSMEERFGNIADLTGNTNIFLNKINSDRNVEFGINQLDILSLITKSPVKLCDLICVYQPNSARLVISDFNIFEKPEKVIYKPRRLDTNNGSGFA